MFVMPLLSLAILYIYIILYTCFKQFEDIFLLEKYMYTLKVIRKLKPVTESDDDEEK